MVGFGFGGEGGRRGWSRLVAEGSLGIVVLVVGRLPCKSIVVIAVDLVRLGVGVRTVARILLREMLE